MLAHPQQQTRQAPPVSRASAPATAPYAAHDAAALRPPPAVAPRDALSARLARCVGERATGGPLLQRDLTKREYAQVKEVARKIMERYPPAEYRYIGLGKSPTPVIAFLQTYGESDHDVAASNMPLSKFAHRTSDMTAQQATYVGGAALTDEQRDRLWEHFDNFVLRGDDPAQPKGIVLIDHVESGKSLFATQRHLDQYLRERYLGTGATGMLYGLLARTGCGPVAPPRVEMLPLTIAETLELGGNKKTMEALELTQRSLPLPGELADKDSLAALMGGEKYKPIAEVPADFKITDPAKPRTGDIVKDPRGDYAELRRQMKQFMDQDAEIVTVMSGEASVDLLEETVAPLLQSATL